MFLSEREESMHGLILFHVCASLQEKTKRFDKIFIFFERRHDIQCNGNQPNDVLQNIVL